MSEKSLPASYKKDLIVPDPIAPFCFPQCKTHKPNQTFRLITSSKFIPHARASKQVEHVDIIQPVLKDLSISRYTCTNSKMFVEKLQSTPPPPGTVPFKADVVALFPSISQELIIADLKKRCHENPDILTKHQTSAETIVSIVQFIFETTYVRHDNTYYLQLTETPMGGCLSSYLTDISLSYFDKYINTKMQYF